MEENDYPLNSIETPDPSPKVSMRDRLIMLALCLVGAIVVLRPVIAFQNFSRGNFFLDNGSPKKAISQYQRAILLSPDFSDAYGYLGFAYKQSKQINEAIKAYNKALEINPKDSQVYFELGGVYFNRKDFKTAASYFQKAAALNPSDPNYRNMYAVSLYRIGRADEAISIWEGILQKNPEYNPAKINLDKYR